MGILAEEREPDGATYTPSLRPSAHQRECGAGSGSERRALDASALGPSRALAPEVKPRRRARHSPFRAPKEQKGSGPSTSRSPRKFRFRWRWVTPRRGRSRGATAPGSPLRGRHLHRTQTTTVQWITSFSGLAFHGGAQPSRSLRPPEPPGPRAVVAARVKSGVMMAWSREVVNETMEVGPDKNL